MFTAFFLTAALGRVGLAMTPLSLLFFVHSRTGSYATAGAAVAGLAVAEALAGPFVAGLVDRHGQPGVLPVLAVLHAAALVLAWQVTPSAALPAFGLGLLLGASMPQLGAYAAARWSHRETGNRLQRAFGQEALANSLAFVAAPVLVGLLVSPLPIAGSVTVLGTLLLAVQQGAPPVSRRAGGFALPRGVLRPLTVNALIGVHFGALPLAVTAGHPGVATWLLAASSAGGLVAGLTLARLTVPPRWAVWLLATPAAMLPLPFPDPALAVVLFLTGAGVPPVIVAASVRARERTAPQRLTATFAWLASCSAAGSALGAWAGGNLVDSHVTAAFGLAGFCAVAVVFTEFLRR